MISSVPISQNVINALAQDGSMLMYAAELDFKDGMVRLHTGTGDIIIGGEVFSGIGTLGSVSTSRETDDSSSPLKIDLVLSGVSQDVVKDALQDKCRGRAGRVYFVVASTDGSIAADILFSGRMDAARFSYSKDDSSITIPIVDRMAEWSRRNTKRWTDENHRLRYPNDRFFKAVSQVSEWVIRWGRGTSTGNGSGGGGSPNPQPPQNQR